MGRICAIVEDENAKSILGRVESDAESWELWCTMLLLLAGWLLYVGREAECDWDGLLCKANARWQMAGRATKARVATAMGKWACMLFTVLYTVIYTVRHYGTC